MRLGLLLILACTSCLAQDLEAAFRQDPGPLDFIRGRGEEQAILQSLTGDALVGLGPAGELVPRLARRWEVRKGELRFTLRHEATFPDGSQVTPKDALWTLQEVQRNPGADPAKRQILIGASVFVQAHQLVIRTNRPLQPFLRDLARIPIARRDRPWQGSGPFTLTAGPDGWKLHRRVHFLGPRLQGLRFRRVADATAEGALLAQGQLHLGPLDPGGPPPRPGLRALSPSPTTAPTHWVDDHLVLEPGPTGLFSGTPGPAAWHWRDQAPRSR